ncbi:MAG: hypothetical protein QG635_566 [Bacteroidota bacterium]|nr:hypothetical protein [Bacteroidota bacterium]
MNTKLRQVAKLFTSAVILFLMCINSMYSAEMLVDGKNTAILNYGYATDFDFSADGNYIGVLCGSGFVMLDLNSKKVVYNIIDQNRMSFELSHDRREIAILYYEMTFKIFNLESGEKLKDIIPEQNINSLMYYQWSSDNQRILGCYNYSDTLIKILDLETSELFATIHPEFDTSKNIHVRFFGKISISPDNKTAALIMSKYSDTAAPEYYIDFFNISTGIRIKTEVPLKKYFKSIAWSPDSKKVCCLPANDSTLYIYNSQDGSLNKKITDTIGAIISADWSPDSKQIEYLYLENKVSRLCILDVDKAQQQNYKFQKEIRLARWKDDDNMALYSDGRIYFLNVKTGMKFDSLMGFELKDFFISWNPKYPLLLVNSNDQQYSYMGDVNVWNTDSLKIIETSQFYAGVLTESAWSPDGKEFAYNYTVHGKCNNKAVSPLGGNPEYVNIVDSAFKEVRSFFDYKVSYSTSLDWSPDGSMIAYAGGSDFSDENKFYISVFNTDNLFSYNNFYASDSPFTDVSWSPDGSIIAARSYDGLGLWNVNDGSIIRRYENLFPTDNLCFNTIDWNNDGSLIYYIKRRDTVNVEDIKTGEIVKQIVHGKYYYFNSIMCSGDGAKLACGLEDGTIRVYDTQSWLLLNEFKGHLGAIRSLSFSKNNYQLAACDDVRCIRIWDLSTTGVDVAESENNENSQILIEPNPGNVQIKISFNFPVKNVIDCSIFDVLGRKAATVIRGVINDNKQTIETDVSFLAPGCYLIVASTGKKIYSGKLFIDK